MKPLVPTILLLAAATASAAEHKYMKAFPPAKEGMVRYAIVLPHKDRSEEGDFRVELIVGKEMLTDGINRVFLGGQIKAKPLKGWGFTYYEVEAFGPAASTLMAVPPGTPKVKRFVTAKPLQIRYNSRIPVIVYVPAGGEVRYRIWQASKETLKAEKS